VGYTPGMRVAIAVVAFLLAVSCFCSFAWDIALLTRFAGQNRIGPLETVQAVAWNGWIWMAFWGVSGIAFLTIAVFLFNQRDQQPA
jgi:hypothetical protein